jgi:hypothetical protein
MTRYLCLVSRIPLLSFCGTSGKEWQIVPFRRKLSTSQAVGGAGKAAPRSWISPLVKVMSAKPAEARVTVAHPGVAA